jgi:hypothetical protein
VSSQRSEFHSWSQPPVSTNFGMVQNEPMPCSAIHPDEDRWAGIQLESRKNFKPRNYL